MLISKTMSRYFFLPLLLVFSLSACAEKKHDHNHSKYAGQENRVIKSLSTSDISELQRGGGWGLAKAAELNGVPGPAHILELADKIDLSDKQKTQVTNVFNEMNAKAVTLGKQLIQLETKLNTYFADRTIDATKLEKTVTEIAQVRAKLRLSHLSAHLKTPDILSKHQIMRYNQLRGYGKSNPCDNVPEGHNPEMWKKHNGCS